MNPYLEAMDSSDPKSVVAAFIKAMSAWEAETADFHGKNQNSGDHNRIWKTTNEKLAVIFAELCTDKERPYGRNGSFQTPPEYDPKNEVVKTVDVSGQRAKVETFRKAILGGGRYQYVLLKQGDRWLIDNVKYYDSGKWTKAIL